MKQSNCIWGLFLLCLLIVLPNNIALAAGGIQIADAQMTQTGDSLEVGFSIENTDRAINEIKYGIRVQSLDGGKAYEVPVDSAILEVGESRVLYMTVPLPAFVDGQQDVFILSRDEQGIVSILKYVGNIDIASETDKDAAQLNQCKAEEGEITCNIINTDENEINIQYSVTKGSAYGSLITGGVSNNVKVIDNKASLKLPTDMPGGYYTYTLWLANKVDAQQVVVSVDVTLSEEAAIDSVSNKKDFNYAKLFVIFAPILLLVSLVYVAMRRPKALLLAICITGLSSSGLAIAAITLTDSNSAAHIFSGFSQDSGTEQFAITLDNAEVQTTDTIGVSVVFQNVALPNSKPTGGSIDMNVNGGAWQSFITTSDTGSIYHKTIAAISTPGTHALNFRSPDLCGSAFGFSLFNTGIFGSTECLFSVNVVVVQNDPPTTPSIGGSCILGEPCSIGIVSTDTDGGQLCYEIDWPTGLNTNAGCALEANPVSATRTFNSCDAADTTVRAQATDASSESSAWGSEVVGCSESCSHCTYNGTSGDISISATPSFIPPTGTVNISWSLTNVRSCSIEVYDMADDVIVETWDWDYVRQNSSKQVSSLTNSTKYTLSCTDLADGPAEAQVTIVNIPTWQEF